MLAQKYLSRAITHQHLMSQKSIFWTCSTFSRIRYLSKTSRIFFQSWGNTFPRPSTKGPEIQVASLTPQVGVLEGNSQGIGMVGGKVGRGRTTIILGAGSTTVRVGLKALANLGSTSFTLFKVDKVAFPFLFSIELNPLLTPPIDQASYLHSDKSSQRQVVAKGKGLKDHNSPSGS